MSRRRLLLQNVIGVVSDDFIITVKTDNAGTSASNQFTIPTNTVTYTYLYDVDWGDGNIDVGVTGNITHTYSVAGTYDVAISGDFPQIYFNNTGDAPKLTEIKNWGNIVLGFNQTRSYNGCVNLTSVSATDTPNTTALVSLNTFMTGCSSLTTINRFNEWDVSGVTTISFTFLNCPLLNVDMSNMNFSSNLSNANQFSQTANSLDTSFVGWDITGVTVFDNFLRFATGISTANYDATLIDWESTLQASFPNGVGYTPVISINFGGSTYSLGGLAETARTSLITNYGWSIVDGGGI